MKTFITHLLLALSLVVLGSSICLAEMVLCDGVWTNSSCKGISQKQVNGNAAITQEQEALVRARSKKRSILHEVTMSSINAKREHGVDLSLDKAQEVCRDDAMSVDKCREVTEAFSDRLNKNVSQAVKIAKTDKKKKEEEQKPPPVEQSTVVIIREPTYIIDGHRKYKHRDHIGHRGHHQGEHRRTNVGGGASVNVSGKSADGRFSIGVNAGGSSHTGSHSTNYKVANGSVVQKTSSKHTSGGLVGGSGVGNAIGTSGKSKSHNRSKSSRR